VSLAILQQLDVTLASSCANLHCRRAQCFEGVASLTFNERLIITAMASVEGEKVPLATPVNTARARGSVEKWLLDVEGGMFASVHAAVAAGALAHLLEAP
jgi:Dynein heavy chain, N-terminal region 2